MGVLTFPGGIEIEEFKEYTEFKDTEKLPIPERIIIPLSQHIGSEAKLIVKTGDYVKTGQLIGESTGFISANVHASISGTVEKIIKVLTPQGRPTQAVVIKSDGKDEKIDGWNESSDSLSREQIIERIKDAGVVGMGGATFPTHVKLSPPPNTKIDTLILNGAECEPFLTSDHRLMLEYSDELLKGISIIKEILNINNVYIGIENNKPDAISLLTSKVGDYGFKVVSLKTKYPQGAEKNLIWAITKREVPAGGLPLDVGVVVQNVATAKAIYDAVVFKKPLIERIVTVSGDAIREPKNLLVRIGTTFSDIFSHCKEFKKDPYKIISGGPMMGFSIPYIENFSVTKGTSGILVFSREFVGFKEEKSCIRCAKCVDHCPMRLLPNHLEKIFKVRRYEEALNYDVNNCVECGTCSWVCPAHRPLVHSIRYLKGKVRNIKK